MSKLKKILQKVKVETLSFEKHPCRELEQQEMIHYLNGLALISSADENICEKEKEYLSILINSFGLQEEMIETVVNFAENPDEDLIQDMMESFATKDIKYNFMIDCMMISTRDGNFDETEKEIIEEYFEMFKITKKEAEDLKYIFEMFYTQNANALYRYFKRNEYMKIELFQYLLDYYKIDMAYELTLDEKKILELEFFKPIFRDTNSKSKLGKGASEIMTKPINNAQLCIFLNTLFMLNDMEINGNAKVVDKNSKDLLFDPQQSDIVFEQGKFFIKSAEDEEKNATGVTLILALRFVAWISKEQNTKYSLAHFHVAYHDNSIDSYIDMSGFGKYPILKEFFYTTADKSNNPRYCVSPVKIEEYFIKSYIEISSTTTASFRLMKMIK